MTPWNREAPTWSDIVKSIPEWFRGLGAKPESKPVSRGIIESRGQIYLVAPEQKIRGLKLVSVTSDQLARYHQTTNAYIALQAELRSLPRTLRERKPPSRKAREPEAVEA